MAIFDYYVALPAQLKSSLVIILVLSLLFIFLGKKIEKIKPEDASPKWVFVLEQMVSIVNNFVKENIGKRWRFYAPYIFTLALYLAVANLSGLLGFTPPTSNVNVTGGLAVISFILIQGSGFKSLGVKGYFKSLFQPVFFMFPLNVIGEITLPFSMALRLFGNILSGVVMTMLIYGVFGWPAVIVTPAFHAIFDILFGLIQALVFVLLTVIFISMKIDDEEKIYTN